MTDDEHDPLCAEYGNGGWIPGVGDCQCELIAAVVDREYHRWASRIIDCLFPDDDPVYMEPPARPCGHVTRCHCPLPEPPLPQPGPAQGSEQAE